MSFRLFYTEVIGQIDEHYRYTTRQRTSTSHKAGQLAERVLLGSGSLPGRSSYSNFDGSGGVVVDRIRAVAPDGHFARSTHADQCGSADCGSSNSTTSATGNRELYDG